MTCMHSESCGVCDGTLGELEALRKEVAGIRRVLWVLARREGLALHVPKAELDLVPDEAELLYWYEPIFDEVIVKGICKPINQPDLAKPVGPAPKCETCGSDGGSCLKCGGSR